jgi:hypothetical protein
MRIRGFLAGFAVAVLAQSARAQVGGQGTGVLVPIPNRTFVGFNPLGIPFDIFTAEVETGVAQGITLGGLGSYIDIDNKRYTTLDFKFRYYPGEVVLRGFSLGASLGYLNYNTPQTTFSPNGTSAVRAKLITPTVGVIADYNFMLGMQHRFIVGTGVGAKRVLANAVDRDAVGIDRAYLTGRFVVGIAF